MTTTMTTAIVMIAKNTFRQTVRQRLFYNVLLFGLGMLVLSMVVSQITFGFPDRVVRSIGLSGVTGALDLMALLLGTNLIHQEIDRKTLFVVLARPVRRWQYVTGRYLGLLAALLCIAIGLSCVFALVLAWARGSLTMLDVVALSSSFPEAAVLAAVGLVLSTFSSPTVGTGIGIGVWIVGASSDDLMRLTQDQPLANHLSKAISYAFPSLERFNFREAAIYHLNVGAADVGVVWIYGALYATALVAVASAILLRREMV